MAAATKKLKRLPNEGQIAGVCAGLAAYFDIDVTLIRVAFVVFTVLTGGGFLIAYIILALIMPSAREKGTENDLSHNVEVLAAEMRDSGRGDRLRNYFGAGLIILGLWLLLGALFPGWWYPRWDYLWPIVLIVLGIYVATRRKS